MIYCRSSLGNIPSIHPWNIDHYPTIYFHPLPLPHLGKLQSWVIYPPPLPFTLASSCCRLKLKLMNFNFRWKLTSTAKSDKIITLKLNTKEVVNLQTSYSQIRQKSFKVSFSADSKPIFMGASEQGSFF